MISLKRVLVIGPPLPVVVPLLAVVTLPLLSAGIKDSPMTATTARATAITSVLAKLLAQRGVPHGGIND